MNYPDTATLGKTYNCYVDGKYSGQAVYTDDENIGLAFIQEADNVINVYIPDFISEVNLN